jgi:hypothetical protein
MSAPVIEKLGTQKMSEKTKIVVSKGLTEDEIEVREVYLNTVYKDSRASFIQLFTLTAGTLVLYTTLIKDNNVSNKEIVYFGLLASVVVSLIGFYILKIAGEKATNTGLWAYVIPAFNNMTFEDAALKADQFLETSGLIYIFALGAMVTFSVF